MNATVMSSPVERGLERLGRLGVVALAGVEHDLALGERQPDRGVALGDEATRAWRPRSVQRVVDDGVDRRLVREEPADGGVVAVDQQRRRVPTAGLEADQVDARAGREREGDLVGPAERLGGVGQRPGADQRDRRDVRAGRGARSARAARAGSGRWRGA